MTKEKYSSIYHADLEKEMRTSYLDYSMSVIVSRALPDVRDGLKPVHRRILYGMQELGLQPDKPYRKSARLVGDVMGKFHPHGDSAIYDAVVRLAQDFNTRYPLADGQGNYGSIDGDGAAAMRYTEVRMTKLALEMLRDINKDTVDFQPNFDESEQEPSILPARFPNLLVNGSTGIAVGMATNMAPHNLRETIDACVAYIDNPDISIDGLMEYIKGPDFPTYGKIMGKSGIRKAYHTGRGKITMRATAEVEEVGNRSRIVVTELPYQVNKAKLVKTIADYVRDKKLEGISDLRDESDRKGMRIVLDVKRDSNPEIVLNNLYKQTQLQATFGIINLCLVDGVPRILTLKELIDHYVDHQVEVVTRRTQFDLNTAQAREHIVQGLLIAIDNIDEVIKIIRSHYDDAEIKAVFTERFGLSDKQGQAILDMQLKRLSGLQRERLEQEHADLLEKIAYLQSILADRSILMGIIKDELTDIKDRFGDDRRTELCPAAADLEDADMIEERNVLISLTHQGYIKRTVTDEYKLQRRGGKGVIGMTTKDSDFVRILLTTSTHDDVLFFTTYGRAFVLKPFTIPESRRTGRGTPIVNFLNLEDDEKITAMVNVTDPTEEDMLVLLTKQGLIKKTPLIQFKNIRSNGLKAVTLRDDDLLIAVKIAEPEDDIMVVTRKGKAIRFTAESLRPTGRASMGVRSMRTDEDDQIVQMVLTSEGDTLLVASEHGYGKRTLLTEFRAQNRGGKGLIAYRVTKRTGGVADAVAVTDEDEVLLVSTKGDIIRIAADSVSIQGRSASGVKVKDLDPEDEKIISVAKYIEDEDEADRDDSGQEASE